MKLFSLGILIWVSLDLFLLGVLIGVMLKIWVDKKRKKNNKDGE